MVGEETLRGWCWILSRELPLPEATKEELNTKPVFLFLLPPTVAFFGVLISRLEVLAVADENLTRSMGLLKLPVLKDPLDAGLGNGSLSVRSMNLTIAGFGIELSLVRSITSAGSDGFLMLLRSLRMRF